MVADPLVFRDLYTPTFARLMRGQVLTITAREYVAGAA